MHATFLGDERVDGIPAHSYNYPMPMSETDPPMNMRIYVAADNGLPLKVMELDQDHNALMTMYSFDIDAPIP